MYPSAWRPFTFLFIVLGILGFAFSYGLYPDFPDDDTLGKKAFLDVVIWSGICLAPIAFFILAALGIMVVFPFMFELLGLAMLMGWIWNWIVIADDSTWDKIHSDYTGIYAIIIAYQVLYALWLVWYLWMWFVVGTWPLIIGYQGGYASRPVARPMVVGHLG